MHDIIQHLQHIRAEILRINELLLGEKKSGNKETLESLFLLINWLL